jgi:uncharacterized protein (TIGR02271 family)
LARRARQQEQEQERQRDTIPVVEERAVVRKAKRITGVVQARTVVSEREERLDVPVETEEVEVERVSLDRWVEAPLPVRQEGDTTVIPLHEEVLVVEKRLKLVGEVRLTRHRSTAQATRRVTLRREDAVVERVEAEPAPSA